MKSNIVEPEILLPAEGVDLGKWASVACDQFTAEPDYWRQLEEFVGDAPSTLHITIPEIYLKDGDLQDRIANAQNAMRSYLRTGVLRPCRGFVLTEREVGHEVRVGLMVAIDLEAYDFHRVRAPFRATEDTLMHRLPVRVDMRRAAVLETPHVMMLMDDDKKGIIEPLYARRDSLKKLYDFDLNMGGGHIRGWLADDPAAIEAAFDALLDPDEQIRKYGFDAGVQLVVGDGNHSVAAAKLLWEEKKTNLSEQERENHPARYLLTEVVNLYGGGMEFEPINRAVFGVDGGFIRMLSATLQGTGKLKLFDAAGAEHWINAPANAGEAIRRVQLFLETYKSAHAEADVEFVHNERHLKEVVMATGGVGIVMPRFHCEDLIPYVMKVGNLPKKAFSIGEPEQKRYYLECRLIDKEDL